MVLNQITNLANREYTVITTTHNPGQSIELGGWVLMMTGSTHLFGRSETVLTENNLHSVYDLNVFMEQGKFRTYATFQDDSGIHRLVY